MLKQQYVQGLSSSKINWRTALENVKRYNKSVLAHKELGIFVGEDKKELLRKIEYTRNMLTSYKKDAMNYMYKLSLYNMLTGGDDIETTLNMSGEKIELDMDDDFSEATTILESGQYTDHYDSECEFNERIDHNFNGTYPITIERVADYEDFIRVLIDDMIVIGTPIEFSISFEEWKTGYKIEGKRQTKLNKYLNKQGFSKYTLDYYSQQSKTEKELFLTVSDKVQHITGMSYYSDDEWSSCQNPENNYHESVRLIASLYDDKLLVAFTHDNLEDLEEMREDGEENGKMLSRTVCRLITIEGKQFLIGTKKYGSHDSRTELEKALRQVNGFGIFSHEQMANGSIWHTERTNGQYRIDGEEEVYVNQEFEDYVTCDCPVCSGSGKYTVYTSNDNEVEVDCPGCNGSGEVETHVSVYIDEYVTVDGGEDIEPYDEGYNHNGHEIDIRVDYSVLGI